MFDTDQGNLGGKMGFISFALCVICFAVIVLWFEIPEMKNRTYAELDEMFETECQLWKFGSYVVRPE
jgi:hypothetical protein